MQATSHTECLVSSRNPSRPASDRCRTWGDPALLFSTTVLAVDLTFGFRFLKREPHAQYLLPSISFTWAGGGCGGSSVGVSDGAVGGASDAAMVVVVLVGIDTDQLNVDADGSEIVGRVPTVPDTSTVVIQ
ncbi:hypothetical protein CMUS01_14424 [Colletotrichum musicola]|uniref:Uncharacterized protein n=1 Tax=Colletotrichum musicola TaxID=2175873 RepID=A0A8H6MRF3_9PEZI|nr:hypothetical protein CMUS01_14424 [Colletotrichum musicola]